MTDPLRKPVESYPYGRPGIMTLRVVEILPDGVLTLEAETSTIIGEIRNPYQPPYEETHLKARINRTYITTGHPLYRRLDPLADYAVGDRVAVIEQFFVKNPNRMLGGVDLEADDGTGHNPEIQDFITNPRPYYQKPQERAFDAIYYVVGKWRVGTTTVLADQINMPFPFNLNLNDL